MAATKKGAFSLIEKRNPAVVGPIILPSDAAD
jgi:hypothetical protein